jgi:MoxR-like ATPase
MNEPVVHAPAGPASANAEALRRLRAHLQTRVLGQAVLVDRLLIALLADGHLLVEGAPGLAKTTAIKELAAGLEADFQRLQFTPDLLPGDLTGTEVYRPQSGEFHFQRGPLFHHLILADEINRAPAKVQSALLEAMAERQITVGSQTYPLGDPFLVMATQNPIEQEGTYPLPEAQLDRFLLYVRIGYPAAETERAILDLARRTEPRDGIVSPVQVTRAQLSGAREEVRQLHMAAAVEDYLIQLVLATREPGPYAADLERWVAFGASPRATIALDRCARAHAWLLGKDYVSPADVQAVAPDVLRHRILVSYEAEAEGVTSDRVVATLLAQVPVT